MTEKEKEFKNLYKYIRNVDITFSQCEEIYLKIKHSDFSLNHFTDIYKIPNKSGTEYTVKMVDTSLQSFKKFPKAFKGIKTMLGKTKYHFFSKMRDNTIIIITV